MEAQKLHSREDIERITGLPTSTLYELMARGDFPKPIKISGRRVAWLDTELIEWQEARIAERDAQHGEAA